MSELNLASLLLLAAEDSNNWSSALARLAKECGALAAIITLRSSKNAEIIISTELEVEYHTPYVGGFPPEMVQTYVELFRHNDPWAKIQSGVHPYLPTIMSDHLPITQFEKTDFGRWVAPSIFNDTVVVEIGQSKNYWTALNLYFMNNGDDTAEHIMKMLKERLEDLKRAWALSRNTQQSILLNEQLVEEVRKHPSAIILIDAESRVQAVSVSAQQLRQDKIFSVCARTSQLSIASSVYCDFMKDAMFASFDNETGIGAGYTAQIDNSLQSVTPTGEKIGMEIIRFSHWRESQIDPWEHPTLGERERLQVITIAKTNRIGAAAKKLQIGERRNRQIWERVRQKLGGITKSELVTLYRQSGRV